MIRFNLIRLSRDPRSAFDQLEALKDEIRALPTDEFSRARYLRMARRGQEEIRRIEKATPRFPSET